MVMSKKKMTAMVVTVMFALLSSVPAFAALFTFDGITRNKTADTIAGESQFDLAVTKDDIDHYVTFTVSNKGPAASSIARIYFQDMAGLLNSYSSFVPIGNVSYKTGASPPVLPGGNSIGGFSVHHGFSAKNPAPKYGINPDESLGIIFSLEDSNFGYQDVISSMTSGNLRFGMHVIGFDSGGSEAFVNHLPPVHTPIPGTVFLFGSGLTLLVFCRRRTAED